MLWSLGTMTQVSPGSGCFTCEGSNSPGPCFFHFSSPTRFFPFTCCIFFLLLKNHLYRDIIHIFYSSQLWDHYPKKQPQTNQVGFFGLYLKGFSFCCCWFVCFCCLAWTLVLFRKLLLSFIFVYLTSPNQKNKYQWFLSQPFFSVKQMFENGQLWCFSKTCPC